MSNYMAIRRRMMQAIPTPPSIPTITLDLNHYQVWEPWSWWFSVDDGATWTLFAEAYEAVVLREVTTSQIKLKFSYFAGVPFPGDFTARIGSLEGEVIWAFQIPYNNEVISDNFNFTENTTIYIRGQL